MTSEEFCQWITGASKSIQDSIITDLSWWEQRDTVLHHQFLLLRFEHLEPGGSMQFYELRLERAGKSLAGRAIDTMTISSPPPMVAPEFFKRYKLLFALLTHPEIVAPPCHSSGQNPRSISCAGPTTADRERERQSPSDLSLRSSYKKSSSVTTHLSTSLTTNGGDPRQRCEILADIFRPSSGRIHTIVSLVGTASGMLGLLCTPLLSDTTPFRTLRHQVNPRNM
jgi:hypothetical protein